MVTVMWRMWLLCWTSCDGVIRILSQIWYQAHVRHPYPNTDELHGLAEEGGITHTQAKGWFVRRRRKATKQKQTEEQQRKRQQLQLQGVIAPATPTMSLPAPASNKQFYAAQEHSNLTPGGSLLPQQMTPTMAMKTPSPLASCQQYKTMTVTPVSGWPCAKQERTTGAVELSPEQGYFSADDGDLVPQLSPMMEMKVLSDVARQPWVTVPQFSYYDVMSVLDEWNNEHRINFLCVYIYI